MKRLLLQVFPLIIADFIRTASWRASRWSATKTNAGESEPEYGFPLPANLIYNSRGLIVSNPAKRDAMLYIGMIMLPMILHKGSIAMTHNMMPQFKR